MGRAFRANRFFVAALILAFTIAARAVAPSMASAVTEQQAAIVKATVAWLNPSGDAPDRPIVLEIATADRYALTRWIWGYASGDALLVSDNGAWRVIEASSGSYDALGLERSDGVPEGDAVALVSPANRVEINKIPANDTADRFAGKLGCGYAFKTYYHMNLPANTTKPSTEVAHADALMYHGDAVGWLLRTRKGSLWYADGPINVPAHRKAPEKIAIGVLYQLAPAYNATLGTTPQDGSLWPVTAAPNMLGIAGLGISVRSCF
jgi:hypothetical protein